ncbi:DIS3-exonuclease-like protein [Hirschfeldia incana]|nr:DIS3-exonuclease-like protein [Hirschfeldia incana]
MLQLFFTIAFSAAPLTLYIPPIRCLTMFVETMEEMGMEGRVYSRRVFPRARIAWSRLLDCFFSSSPPPPRRP